MMIKSTKRSEANLNLSREWLEDLVINMNLVSAKHSENKGSIDDMTSWDSGLVAANIMSCIHQKTKFLVW